MNFEIIQSIDKQLDMAIETYRGMRLSENRLGRFSAQFDASYDSYEFLHGYFIGELQGIAFATARLLLERDMDDVETKQIAELIKKKSIVISNIINSMKKHS